MAENWKWKAAPSSQITSTFVKSKGWMVSVFAWNNRAVFQIVFRRLLHVHMLVSIERINYFWIGNDEYYKYYKTNSSYHLRKLEWCLDLNWKRPTDEFMCGFNFFLSCEIRDMSWFLTANFTFTCWFVNETSYHR